MNSWYIHVLKLTIIHSFPPIPRDIKRKFFFIFFLLVITLNSASSQTVSQQRQALLFLDSLGPVAKSIHWPNINPQFFIKNLRRNIEEPLWVYAGRSTNFCGYGAITYPFLKKQPLDYARFLVSLYKNGSTEFRNINYKPSSAIRIAAGQLIYKGELDINHADQLWFLLLADHYKGYLNWINLNYDPGDENTLWASTNFAKFNRMLKRVLDFEVHSRGSDLVRPSIPNLTAFLKKKLAEGEVFLYLNNTILRKKNHNKVKRRLPTHFVELLNITEENGVVNVTYWDYGLNTLQQLSLDLLDKILHGVTWGKKRD